LEDWWTDSTRDALCVYGRRRVGKSWLFRRFADGKEAVVLVADERAFAPQFALFAAQFEDVLGVRPAIEDASDLVRLLYRLGRERPLLAVIDEFPSLLPRGGARKPMLSAIAAVMEDERDASKTKLLLCGSIISQMESLLAQSSPVHGRLQPLDVRSGYLTPPKRTSGCSSSARTRSSVACLGANWFANRIITNQLALWRSIRSAGSPS
jgi:AAA+ ATPase superfamily predicted ATPase